MLKNLLKTTLLFAAIGFTVGLAAPTIGSALLTSLGLNGAILALAKGTSIYLHAAGMATTFGFFGAASSLLSPVFDAVFGTEHNQTTKAHNPENLAPAIDISPAIPAAQPTLASVTTASFADREEARRETAALDEAPAR